MFIEFDDFLAEHSFLKEEIQQNCVAVTEKAYVFATKIHDQNPKLQDWKKISFLSDAKRHGIVFSLEDAMGLLEYDQDSMIEILRFQLYKVESTNVNDVICMMNKFKYEGHRIVALKLLSSPDLVSFTL